MRWKNHIAIANAVAERLDLPPDLRHLLREGSVHPDKEGDKEVRLDREGLPYRKWVRHHRASKRFIKRLLWRARVAYLEGREEDAVWCLGRALHYIQDGSVAVGPFGIHHDEREATLGARAVMPRALDMGIEMAIPCPFFLDLCLRRLSPKRSSGAAMHQACVLSSALASAVLADPIANTCFEKQCALSYERHRHLFVPLSLAPFPLLTTLSLAWGQPALVLLALPLSILLLRADSHYYFLKRQSTWFVTIERPRANA